MSYPLFITGLSLSSRSAIGVQTKLMLEQFPEWRHLFWDHHEFRNTDWRSNRAESALFSWFTLLKQELSNKGAWVQPSSSNAQNGPLSPKSGLPKMGFSWWDGNNVLKPRYEARLRKLYAANISAIYCAPLSIYDCERMKAILIFLHRPFVLHLWDIMDREQHNSIAFQWLLRNAVHVFCLSEPMIDYVYPFRSDATILRFIRKRSACSAAPPKNNRLRIALIGTHKKYLDGLCVLRDALLILRKQGISAEVVYVGAKKKIRGGSAYLFDEVQMTGFLRSDESRDRALAECHVGFLPGPLASPHQNNYSRFSIPSRILDYLAVGLPVIASVHQDSATAMYMRMVGIEEAIVGSSAERLAERLIALRNPDRWRIAADASYKGFTASQEEKGDLKSWLERAAANAKNFGAEQPAQTIAVQ